ncbi:MAG: hypothetical protein PHS14_06620 [Elusimicrobia bacterium]|nr:hypothetical protein [Elusimicrobiota bacterium]
MTLELARPSWRSAALGAALLIAAGAPAQRAAAAVAPNLAIAHGELSAQAARSIAAQKLARQADAEQRADGWGATAYVPTLLATRVAPDAAYTPGHLCTPTDPNFKEYRYAEHIPYCNRVVTRQMKLEISAHYGVAEADWPNYEFDHLIPLAAGGDSSIDNLWPQPRGNPDGSDGKDRLENSLYLQLKAGAITQAEAVRQIYAWFTSALLIEKMLKVPVS